MLKLDSHQHFWVFDPVRDNWISEDMANFGSGDRVRVRNKEQGVRTV